MAKISVKKRNQKILDQKNQKNSASKILNKKNSKALLTSSDPLVLYLSEIKKYPLLDKEEEKRIAVQYKETGDPKFAEILVTSNLRFVVKIASDYSRFGAQMIDLIQEGNVGLMKAVKEFNPYKNVRLITYAVWWIKGYIQEYLMKQYSVVKIGTTQNQRKLFYRLKKQLKKESDFSSKEENNFLLTGGQYSNIKPSEIESMKIRLVEKDIPLNQSAEMKFNQLMGEASSNTHFSEKFNVDESLEKLQELENLKKHINNIRHLLNEKEIFILDKRLLSDEPLTLQEIGKKYGTSREAVRQAEERLIKKIKKDMI